MSEGSVLLDEVDVAPWKALHARISTATNLAGVFHGWMPAGFAKSTARILYVGKATSGPYEDIEPERKYFNGSGAFWTFARQIAQEIGCPPEQLPCIAWSNISKVSKPQVEADPTLLYGSEELASATLEKEIKLARPNVVVFVTAHFSDQVVARVSQADDDSQWNKSELESTNKLTHDIWWRRRSDGVAILSMRHPMGAGMHHRNFAVRKIAELVAEK